MVAGEIPARPGLLGVSLGDETEAGGSRVRLKLEIASLPLRRFMSLAQIGGIYDGDGNSSDHVTA